MAKIRQQIVKWQRQHNTDRVAGLKETEHFDIKVDVGKDNLFLCITCNICGKRCIISSSNEHIFLSNWTRNVLKCVEKVKTPLCSMGKIKDYFQPLGTPVVSPVSLISSPNVSQHKKLVSNLSSSVSKNDQSVDAKLFDNASVSKNDQSVDPKLFDNASCLKK